MANKFFLPETMQAILDDQAPWREMRREELVRDFGEMGLLLADLLHPEGITSGDERWVKFVGQLHNLTQEMDDDDALVVKGLLHLLTLERQRNVSSTYSEEEDDGDQNQNLYFQRWHLR